MTFLSRALAACLEKFGLIIIISKQAVVDQIQKKKKKIHLVHRQLTWHRFLHSAFYFVLLSSFYIVVLFQRLSLMESLNARPHMFSLLFCCSVVLFFCFLFSVVFLLLHHIFQTHVAALDRFLHYAFNNWPPVPSTVMNMGETKRCTKF